MANYSRLIMVLTAGLLLSSCGGSGSNSGHNVDTVRPGFLFSKIVNLPDYSPTGNIIDTNPTFSWPVTANASEYQFGYEDPANINSWVSHEVTASEANCNAAGATHCKYQPSNSNFVIGDYRAWWVRAKVNGAWTDWSSSHTFTVVKDLVAVGVPVTIAPTGLVTVTKPTFTWEGVANATEYRLGYEEQTTENSWEELTLSAADLGCQNLTQTCVFTPAVDTFKDGEHIGWYVRAYSAGNLGEWSGVKAFDVTISAPTASVIINEVLASNSRTNIDPDFIEFSDWIELYNPSNQDLDISNYGLSDDDQPLQWKFPVGTIIKANEYLIVWADKKNTKAKALHAKFKLSSKGEKITLANSTGLVIDTIDFKKQKNDISAANKNGEIVFMSPTPGAQNAAPHGSSERSEEPNYSHTSGFYDNAISVVLTQSNNAEIYFTLDGSNPDLSSTQYTQPIMIAETSVLRAIAIEDGGLSSEIVSQTYFINHVTTLPVVSMVVDPAYLYDPKTGIYTDGDGTNGAPLENCEYNTVGPKNYTQEWERPADIEYFAANQTLAFNLTAGISIAGQCSRGHEKKPFSVELDSKYGTKTLKYKLYADKTVNKIQDFKFRPGSRGYQVSDTLAAALVKNGNLNIDYQAYTAAQMFVNGDYWGLYNIREKKGSEFLISNYPNLSKKELDIINVGDYAKTGDMNDYNAFLEFLYLKNYDLSADADYQAALALFDEESYIDYMSLMIYSANYDWINSNLRCWKEKKPAKKWRWMVDDIDGGFDNDHTQLNQFSEIMNADSTAIMIDLFRSLVKNTTFKQKFKTRMIELLDTTFSVANMNSVIDMIIDERKDYISLETPVWNSITVDEFDYYVTTLKDFANQRNAVVRSQLDVFIP